MGISNQTFNDLFDRMKHLTGLNVKTGSIKYFFEEFENESVEIIEKAFECMIQSPPPRINREHIANAITEAKKKLNFEGKPVWNGIECEDCISGLVHTKQSNGNYYTWRCDKCRSRIEHYPYYTPWNVDELEKKLSKKFSEKPAERDFSEIKLDVSKNLKEESRKDLV